MENPSSSSSIFSWGNVKWGISKAAPYIPPVIEIFKGLVSSRPERSTNTGPLTDNERKVFREHCKEKKMQFVRPKGIDREFVNLIMGKNINERPEKKNYNNTNITYDNSTTNYTNCTDFNNKNTFKTENS